MLTVGIIGLPNVGKSTLFNALTSGEADVSNYPFTTIDSNIGIVAVPDPVLDELSHLLKPEETNPAFVQFTDIAGLVRGASRGEGLGNQFLGNIRGVDALAHLVRCFEKEDVSHVMGHVDPARDIDAVETELLLADLEVLDRAIEKRKRTWKTSPRQYALEEKRFAIYHEHLAAGTPLRDAQLTSDELRELKGLGMLTSKPVLYVANLSEDRLSDSEDPCVARIRQGRLTSAPTIISLSARLEWELQQLDKNDKNEFLEALGMAESGLTRMVRFAYEVLGLITFYTIAKNKLSAWAVGRGTVAPDAAGKIHSDMAKGFIRAQVASWTDLKKEGSFQALHRRGLIRTEGKKYVIQKGDVVEFLFSS